MNAHVSKENLFNVAWLSPYFANIIIKFIMGTFCRLSCSQLSSIHFGRLISYRSVTAARANNDLIIKKHFTVALQCTSMLAIAVCLTLIYAVKKICNTTTLK